MVVVEVLMVEHRGPRNVFTVEAHALSHLVLNSPFPHPLCFVRLHSVLIDLVLAHLLAVTQILL